MDETTNEMTETLPEITNDIMIYIDLQSGGEKIPLDMSFDYMQSSLRDDRNMMIKISRTLRQYVMEWLKEVQDKPGSTELVVFLRQILQKAATDEGLQDTVHVIPTFIARKI